ncbi:hypothetical protein ACFVTJ_20480 [Agrobacterium sp. NPDC058088]|uniref:hypothetical protein n=1 Tax=Agrobacterium sp. NPDC058088 TaxID=3346335 RepID=UPI0036DC57C4
MRSEKSKLVLAFVMTALLGVCVIWLMSIFWSAIYGADKSIQAAVIAAIVGIFTVAFTYWKERSRSIKEAHRDKKIEVYAEFYDMMFDLPHKSKKGDIRELEGDEDFQKTWFSISKGVLFYGSPKVVRAFSQFKVGSADKLDVMKLVGRLLLSMREDIGLSNSGLDELNIHQIYVTDDIRKLGS